MRIGFHHDIKVKDEAKALGNTVADLAGKIHASPGLDTHGREPVLRPDVFYRDGPGSGACSLLGLFSVDNAQVRASRVPVNMQPKV